MPWWHVWYGMPENIQRILQPFVHKPITTLRQLLTNVKDKDEPRNRQEADYKINRSDCHASYIGETDKNLNTRLTKHKLATRKSDFNDHIAEHHRLTNHTIDWDSAQCLIDSTNYFQRQTLESWLATIEQIALKRCQPLLAPYKRLMHDINITNEPNRTTWLYWQIETDRSQPTYATWVVQPITSRQNEPHLEQLTDNN